MYGYLRIDKNANRKLADYWKLNYCYLCRVLGENYGLISRLTISYDVAFISLLMNHSSFFDGAELHCFKGKGYTDPKMETLAAINVMLSYETIRDKKLDDHVFWADFALLALRKSVKKIRQKHPEIHDKIVSFYEDFRILENNEASMDELASSFGNLMESLGREQLSLSEEACAILRSVAKWIYFIDALDDLDKDRKEKKFNPLTRYGCSAKEFLLNHQDEFQEMYHGLFAPGDLKDGDISTWVVRRTYHYSIPHKTAEIMRRILQ